MSTASGLEVTARDGGAGLHMSQWENRQTATPRHPAAAHHGFEISWIHRGQVEYIIGRRCFVVGQGETIVVPEGVEHETRILPGAVATSIKLSATLVHEANEDLGARVEPGLHPRDALVEPLGRELWGVLATSPRRTSQRGKAILPEHMAQAILRRTLGARRPRPSFAPDARVKRAIDFIEARLSDELDVEDMAKAAGMSRFHFTRSFRRQYGASPYQWLIRRRVERAALLLEKGRLTVTEAAMEVGFVDLGRFSRAFRAQLGCVPSSFGSRARSS